MKGDIPIATPNEPMSNLDELVAALATADAKSRIDHRNAILQHGVACIEPLLQAVAENDDLATQVVAWMEHLAQTQPDARNAAVNALVSLARGAAVAYARAALDRLGEGAAVTTPGQKGGTPKRTAAEAGVLSKIIAAARVGQIITYSDLGTSRGYVGRYLHNILVSEHENGRPAITAIVVQKATGRPGDGFVSAMVELGWAHLGEDAEEVWQRTVAQVFAFWAGQPE